MLKQMIGLFLSLMVLVSFTACATVDNVPVTEQNQITQNEEVPSSETDSTINDEGAPNNENEQVSPDEGVSDSEQEQVSPDKEVSGDEKVQVVLFDVELGITYIDTISANGSILVGRGDDCNIIISGDNYISRRHCRLDYSDGKIYLSDVGSTNGTFVFIDDQWIAISEAVELRIGEQFKIADRILTLQSVESVE